MGAGKGKANRVHAQQVANGRESLHGIKIVTGEWLGPQRHTVLDESRRAPNSSRYKLAAGARDVSCIPSGGFWTELYEQGYSAWDEYRAGRSYRLVPRPEARVLVVDTVEKA